MWVADGHDRLPAAACPECGSLGVRGVDEDGLLVHLGLKLPAGIPVPRTVSLVEAGWWACDRCPAAGHLDWIP